MWRLSTPSHSGLLLLAAALALPACAPATTSAQQEPSDTIRVERRAFVRTLRVTGLTEATRSTTITVPRLQGPGSGVLVVTRLARGGTLVRTGDVLVEFDLQAQQRVAFDRRAEYQDFTAQLARKEAEHAATRAKDESDLRKAENAVARARLEMLKNEMLAAILVEKNQQTLAEAEANLEMLRRTFDLRRRAERAERKALGIQRDRSRRAMEHAEGNIQRMRIRAPQDGLVVLRTVWKIGQMGEVQEGEETRPGLPLLDVVDPSRMRVRARVNQADIPLLRRGQRAAIALDAYPGQRFTGVLETLAPAAATSALSARVRTFAAMFAVDQQAPTLLPDLTAAVDIEVERQGDALVIPRESVITDAGRHAVIAVDGGRQARQAVSLGSVGDTEAVVTAGVAEGAVIRRHPWLETPR